MSAGSGLSEDDVVIKGHVSTGASSAGGDADAAEEPSELLDAQECVRILEGKLAGARRELERRDSTSADEPLSIRDALSRLPRGGGVEGVADCLEAAGVTTLVHLHGHTPSSLREKAVEVTRDGEEKRNLLSSSFSSLASSGSATAAAAAAAAAAAGNGGGGGGGGSSGGAMLTHGDQTFSYADLRRATDALFVTLAVRHGLFSRDDIATPPLPEGTQPQPPLARRSPRATPPLPRSSSISSGADGAWRGGGGGGVPFAPHAIIAEVVRVPLRRATDVLELTAEDLALLSSAGAHTIGDVLRSSVAELKAKGVPPPCVRRVFNSLGVATPVPASPTVGSGHDNISADAVDGSEVPSGVLRTVVDALSTLASENLALKETLAKLTEDVRQQRVEAEKERMRSDAEVEMLRARVVAMRATVAQHQANRPSA